MIAGLYDQLINNESNELETIFSKYGWKLKEYKYEHGYKLVNICSFLLPRYAIIFKTTL